MLGAALALALALGVAAPCRAADFTVDSTLDEADALPGDGLCATPAGRCTLRAAVQEANALPGPDAVDLPAGTCALAIPGADEDAAATGDLDVHGDLVISGAGAGVTVVDAAGIDRAFDARDAALRITRLTLTGGDAGSSEGGAVRAVSCELEVLDCVVSSNAAGVGGGIWAEQGRVTIQRSTLTSNRASLSGGGIVAERGSATIRDSVIERNEALSGAGRGGGIEITGETAEISDTLISSNTAAEGAGAWSLAQAAIMTDCVVSDNVARQEGGGISVGWGTFTVMRTSVLRNEAWFRGGGGLHVSLGGGTLVVVSSTIADNVSRAPTSGGGGGVYVELPGGLRQLPFVLIDSTVSGNHAEFNGGGINFTIDLPTDVARIVNSTISGNTARVSGGGVYLRPYVEGEAILVGSTIAGNSAAEGGGVFEARGRHVVRLLNTVVAGNSGLSPDCSGGVASLGWSLVGDPSGCDLLVGATDLVAVAARLGPLQDNGGPTLTHAPLGGSPLVDGGDPAGCVDVDGSPLLADQRGVPRPLDGDWDGVARCDIGAVEVDCAGSPDSDGDGAGDACDCAPADSGLFAVPGPVRLDVTRSAGSTDAELAWTDDASRPGTAHDVASDAIASLAARGIADAPCVAAAVPGAGWRDTRPVGGTGEGWYYLVRAVNACGPAPRLGWGADSFGARRPACP